MLPTNLSELNAEERNILLKGSDEQAVSDWFWDDNFTKTSLLEKLHYLYQADRHVPLLPSELTARQQSETQRNEEETSSSQKIDSDSEEEYENDIEQEINIARTMGRQKYWSVLNSVVETDLAKMTTTERYLLGYARGLGARFSDKFMKGPEPYTQMSQLQAIGVLDEAVEKLRLQQARRFTEQVDSVLSHLGDQNIPPSQKNKKIVATIVECVVKNLGIEKTIAVEFHESPDPHEPLTTAHFDPASKKINVFPPAFKLSREQLKGVLLHEGLHVEHASAVGAEESEKQLLESLHMNFMDPSNLQRIPPSKASQAFITDRSVNAAESAGRLDPVIYPMQLHHEFEAWMLQLTVEIYSAHANATTTGKQKSSLSSEVYGEISIQALEEKGPMGRLVDYANRYFSLDVKRLGSFIDNETGIQSPDSINSMLYAIKLFREWRKTKLSPDADVEGRNIASEFKADMLRAIPSILTAAQDPNHQFHEDAKLVILAIRHSTSREILSEVIGLKNASQLANDDEISVKYQQKSAQLKTPMGRALFYQVMLESFGIDSENIANQSQQHRCDLLRKAIGLPSEILPSNIQHKESFPKKDKPSGRGKRR